MRPRRSAGERLADALGAAGPASRVVIAAYALHTAELYLARLWLPLLLGASLVRSGYDAEGAVSLAAALAGFMSMTGIGSVLAGGWLSDRLGRPAAAALIFSASGACSFAAGGLVGLPAGIPDCPGLRIWVCHGCRFRNILDGGDRAGSEGARRGRRRRCSRSSGSASARRLPCWRGRSWTRRARRWLQLQRRAGGGRGGLPRVAAEVFSARRAPISIFPRPRGKRVGDR